MATAIEPGTIIDGKYRVLRQIGEGGMGTVYEGENIRIERRVAIKVLHAHVASSPEFAQRFEREARASARIGSPHVCDVLDLGDFQNGERFIVMEYLDGESLEDRLAKKGKLTPQELAPIAFEILEGLGTMHQSGVIHRDLKPANVFLARGPGRRAEVVKILDFGVAKITPRADEPSDMTSTGMMMGTPLYMSPEQARGARDVDGRTDLYAASVMFYRALTGEMPHTGLNLHELLFKIVLEDPRPIIELAPEVDELFAAIVHKGLARDAENRYLSARAYQEEIAIWGHQQGRSSLQFAVTLSSEPPPLRISGGFPAAAVSRQPITGPQPRSEKLGPPTPALARTQTATSAATPSSVAAASARGDANDLAKRQSGGTPTAWAEDAPEIAKRAHAELEAKRRGDTKKTKPSPGAEDAIAAAAAAAQAMIAADGSGAGAGLPTANAAGTEPNAAPVAPVDPPKPSRSAPPKKSQLAMRVLIGAGAVVIIVAAVIGGKMARHDGAVAQGSPSAAPTGETVTTATTPTSQPPPAASQITTTTEPESLTPPAASGSSATKILPLTPATTTAVATTRPTSAPSAKASATASAPPAASTATPTPTGTASGHRKFRTNLE